MTDHISAYPLTWPAWQPRTPANERKSGSFGTKTREIGRNWSTSKRITLNQATSRVIEEVERFTRVGRKMRTRDLIISTNLELRKSDGLPRSGQHPDNGGDPDLFHAINTAWEQARNDIG